MKEITSWSFSSFVIFLALKIISAGDIIKDALSVCAKGVAVIQTTSSSELTKTNSFCL